MIITVAGKLSEAIDDVDASGTSQNGVLNVGRFHVPDLDSVVLTCRELRQTLISSLFA